jgi:hypothetical protein
VIEAKERLERFEFTLQEKKLSEEMILEAQGTTLANLDNSLAMAD